MQSGADAKGKQELDPAIFKKTRIIVDDIERAVHSGEINVPLAKKFFESEISALLLARSWSA